MELIKNIAIGLVIAIHLYIVYLEMFSWEKMGKKAFKGTLDSSLFKPTKTLAANQGLYNFFLAAGLIWTFFIHNLVWKDNIALFFLSCVAIAGIFGALTASKKIFFIQTLPALIPIILIVLKF